jgi:hypothetical protein
VTTTVASFPLSKHTGGGDVTPTFSSQHIHLQFMRGKCPFPPLLWSFPHTATFTSFPTPGCWAGATTPAFFGWLVYLQFCEGFPFPPLQHSGHPTLFATCLSCCYFLFSLVFFFSFFPGWGSVCPGGYADLAQGCLWEYRMPLSSPGGVRLPKQSGSWSLAVQEPSWFLRLTWSEGAMPGLKVWWCWRFASSQ